MFPTVHKIRSDAEARQVIEAARKDQDNLHFPTHAVRRSGEIIGAVSMAAVPLVLLWSHKEKVSARDSLHLKRVYDAIMEEKGHRAYYIACNDRSPYAPHMERFGFKPVWRSTIFVSGASEEDSNV